MSSSSRSETQTKNPRTPCRRESGGAPYRPAPTRAEVAFLAGVTETGESVAVSVGTEQVQEVTDRRRSAHGGYGDALHAQIPPPRLAKVSSATWSLAPSTSKTVLGSILLASACFTASSRGIHVSQVGTSLFLGPPICDAARLQWWSAISIRPHLWLGNRPLDHRL